MHLLVRDINTIHELLARGVYLEDVAAHAERAALLSNIISLKADFNQPGDEISTSYLLPYVELYDRVEVVIGHTEVVNARH